MLKYVLLAFWVICYGVNAHATEDRFIYKWTDQFGKTKYSELPPGNGIAYETVRKLGSTTGVSKTAADIEKERKQLEALEAEEKAKAEAARKAASDARAKNCDIAKKNVEVLSGNKPVVKTDEKGDKYIIDANQRDAELRKARKDQEYYCNP
ncbi:MAG: hypothetical protein CSA09_01050 [Candidatus Contendobacter odensis]|uniref:DUF4124 domain-containing protein n=1 Tax=Candidatus Contendibacter odensensis TaxID=1400860 RepID=A0A2G6PG15_9GAMM|nr:MAG: hypothetical protein CSA09_01050 [Candidatus Contendobacter odensis]